MRFQLKITGIIDWSTTSFAKETSKMVVLGPITSVVVVTSNVIPAFDLLIKKHKAVLNY